MRRLGRWAWAVGPVLLYAALIVYLSSRSSLPSVRFNDKVMHFGEYAVLAFLINRALLQLFPRWRVRQTTLGAVAFASLFGVTDEIHQYFVPNRDASIYDVVADVAGSAFGAMAYVAWADLRERVGRRLLAP